MNNYLRKILDFILFSNVFIALGALAQGLVTYHLLGVEPDKDVLAILFCATLALYNFSILLARPKDYTASPYRRVQWIFSNYRFNVTTTLIATLSLLPLASFLSLPALILLSFLALLSISYSLPIFRFRGHWFALRNVPGVKLFLIALVWSLSCVLLPIVELGGEERLNLPIGNVLLLFLAEFFFVAALTVPFDIRDSFLDKQHDLKTLPTVLGQRMAMGIAFGFAGIYLLLLVLLWPLLHQLDLLALALSVLLSGWVIAQTNTGKNEYFYFLFLDGMLLVQFFILYLLRMLA